jgi:hypothetical protein
VASPYVLWRADCYRFSICSAGLQCLARNLVQFDESFPSHGGLVVQIVLPVDAADIRALLVDLAALEVNIEISADAIATVQSGGFHK